jgi:hypothetical protein
MNAVWLPQRPGVGQHLGILVYQKAVFCSRAGRFNVKAPPPFIIWSGHGKRFSADFH